MQRRARAADARRYVSYSAVVPSTMNAPIDASSGVEQSGRRGTPAALRGWSVPLMAMTSMMTTNRAAPGGARQRRVADVRPRRTESAQDPAWLRGPHTRDSRRCTRSSRCTSARKRAEPRSSGPRLPQPHLGRTMERSTSGRGVGWVEGASFHCPPGEIHPISDRMKVILRRIHAIGAW